MMITIFKFDVVNTVSVEMLCHTQVNIIMQLMSDMLCSWPFLISKKKRLSCNDEVNDMIARAGNIVWTKNNKSSKVNSFSPYNLLVQHAHERL